MDDRLLSRYTSFLFSTQTIFMMHSTSSSSSESSRYSLIHCILDLVHSSLMSMPVTTSGIGSQRLAYQRKPPGPGSLWPHFGFIDQLAAFDYVMVGGGTAEVTIARRLAESHSVAVIEAGSFYALSNDNHTEVPANDSYDRGEDTLAQNPLINWVQKTTLQATLNGRSIAVPQGRTLGGGSARNYMWYQRGFKTACEKWAVAVGDSRYAFSGFLKYSKKSVYFNPLSQLRDANATPSYNPTVSDSSGEPLQLAWSNFSNPVAS